MEVFKIEGVLGYSFVFFSLKFTVYGLLLMLPTYLNEELLKNHETKSNNSFIANTMSSIEVGSIFGGLILGHLSDLTYQKRSPIILISLSISSISLLYLTLSIKTLYNETTNGHLIIQILLILIGCNCGGLLHLVAITCSSDLGTKTKAVSSVTGVIDSFGTFGACIGQLIFAFSIKNYGWQNGYLMVMFFVLNLAFFPMLPIFCRELSEIKQIKADRK